MASIESGVPMGTEAALTKKRCLAEPVGGVSRLPYAVEAQTLDSPAWTSIIGAFDDVFLMQTWPYAARRWGAQNLSHVVLRKDGQVAAAAQVVTLKIPVLGRGIAYVKWGPLWRVRGHEPDTEAFRMIVATLRETFAEERGLLLRIYPNAVEGDAADLRRILEEEGFTFNKGETLKTVLIDLSHSVDELWKSLAGKWRSRLRLSEKNGLRVVEGSDDASFASFITLYKEMQTRKRRPEIFDIDYYAGIQADLPDAFKMRVMLCEDAGQPVAGMVLTCSHDTALMLFAATSNRALQLRASYFLFWQVIQRLKAGGYRWLDLYRIDHEASPGPSEFKTRLAGRLGRFTQYLGQFEACESRVSWCAVKAADRILETHRRVRANISDWLHRSDAASGES